MSAAPDIWGPRVWRLLHGLADVSDRRDVYPLWNSFLKWLAAVIPCQKCQTHMQSYWAHTSFMPKGWDRMNGLQIRAEIRRRLHAFHNAVNERLGKPVHPWSDAAIDMDRGAHLREMQALFDGLKEEWGSAHIEWKRTGNLLISLLKGGPHI